MAECEYLLTYFDARALGEPIRLLLSHVGANWKDIRVPAPAPGTPLPLEIKSKCTFGQVPLLEFNGNKLNQSYTILRFLGRKYKLAGKDDLESAKIDQFADVAVDIQMAIRQAFFEKDESLRPQLLKNAIVSVTEKYLRKLNRLLENKGPYLMTDSIAWADIVIANMVDDLQSLFSLNIADEFPALLQHHQLIFSSQGIKEWIAKRPITPY